MPTYSHIDLFFKQEENAEILMVRILDCEDEEEAISKLMGRSYSGKCILVNPTNQIEPDYIIRN